MQHIMCVYVKYIICKGGQERVTLGHEEGKRSQSH